MWQDYKILRQKYIDSGLLDMIDYERFSDYLFVCHSTAIEGSTLTEEETTALLEKDITAKGKPMEHHLMVKDHYKALLFTRKQALKKKEITPELLKNINAKVMAQTGSVVNTLTGSYDYSKGELRKQNVFAGNTSFPSHEKVEGLLNNFCQNINKINITTSGSEAVLKLSSSAHFNLVDIHPWRDGNGRTARLLMQYIMTFHNQQMIMLFQQDRVDYIKALNNSRSKNSIKPFQDFVCNQQIKFLQNELNKLTKSQKRENSKGMGLMF